MMLIKSLLVLAAVGTASAFPDDCNQLIDELCASLPRGDIAAAVECLESNSEILAHKECAFPEDVLSMLKSAVEEPVMLADQLAKSELASVVDTTHLGGRPLQTKKRVFRDEEATAVPTVFAHGMGDSCFNAGMKQITADAGTHTGSYSVCVPTGDTQAKDTINGFLLSMDKSVDVFAEKIKADPKLQSGFNAIGFSQGNSLIRGYIHKYNDPPVYNVIHVHGTVSGVSGFPNCNPAGILSGICKKLSALCGKLAYNSLVQGILFQANYFRDPLKVGTDAYQKHSALAQWNGEGTSFNSTFKDNFVKVKKLVMVKAKKDTMVFPNDGEWWGHYADGNSYKAIPMNQTKWYTDDTFGLKTVDQQNKIFTEETDGNHLQFTEEQLFGWIDKYF